VLEIEVVGGDAAMVRGILDACFPACDFLLSDRVIETPACSCPTWTRP
jgi:phosphoserine phosphatase